MAVDVPAVLSSNHSRVNCTANAPFDEVAVTDICERLVSVAVVDSLTQCVDALLLRVIVPPCSCRVSCMISVVDRT